MSSPLSDVPLTGNLKVSSSNPLDSNPLLGGLSSKGPSHNSVLILSSETFLLITSPVSGDLGIVDVDMVCFVGGVPRPPPPRSSWKMGIVGAFSNAPFFCYTGMVKKSWNFQVIYGVGEYRASKDAEGWSSTSGEDGKCRSARAMQDLQKK